ncbi:hypothetical protein ACSSS7_003487 [Eimeria intestinalis]
MLSTFFGSACSVDIALDREGRKCTWLSREKKGEKLPIYSDVEDVSGVATLNLKTGKKLEHNGIKVELVGQVDMLYDRSSTYDFFSISKDLEPPGLLLESKKYKFKFNAVDKAHETYSGLNVRLRYFVRLTIHRNYARQALHWELKSCEFNSSSKLTPCFCTELVAPSTALLFKRFGQDKRLKIIEENSIVKEHDFVVQNVGPPPEIKNSIKMEVGIEDCLHIEFEFDKSRYHLKDVVIGKVYFVLVRIKIKDMQLDIIKTETAGSGSSKFAPNSAVYFT